MRDEAPSELIRRASRDRAAFAQLYDLYLPRIYAFCRRYSHGREDAEDLTAQVFEKALAGIRQYEDRGVPFSAWLPRIAANTVIDRARRLERLPIAADEFSHLREDSFLLSMHITHRAGIVEEPHLGDPVIGR